MRGYVFTEIVGNSDKLEAAKRSILQGLSTAHYDLWSTRIFTFDDFVEAHRYLESNQQIGKIIVTVPRSI